MSRENKQDQYDILEKTKKAFLLADAALDLHAAYVELMADLPPYGIGSPSDSALWNKFEVAVEQYKFAWDNDN